MLLPKLAVFLSLFYSATAVLYITEQTYQYNEATCFGCCQDTGTVYTLRVWGPGLPPVSTSCNAEKGTYVATSGTSFSIGRCTNNDYKESNGRTWQFCPTPDGGILQSIGENGWRLCFHERDNYWLGKCPNPLNGCRNDHKAVIWCHDQLHPFGSKREISSS